MKKITLSFIAAVFAINFSYAQYWTGGPTGPIYYNGGSGGNVGIGTTSPQAALDVAATYEAIRLQLLSVTNTALLFRGTPDGSGYEHAKVYSDRDYSAYTYGSYLSFYTEGKSSGTTDLSVERMRINAEGNVGIGTTTPQSQLSIGNANFDTVPTFGTTTVNGEIWNTAALGADHGFLRLSAGGATTPGYKTGIDLTGYGSVDNNQIRFYTSSTEAMRVISNGNVGIGTTTPDQLLSVNGNIHAQEVLVNLTGFEDRVFKKTYHLPTLPEVKTYIEKNHHLPDVPSEAEVMKNGLKLGDMDRLLTKKVEELTLYLIEKDKTITNQQQQLSSQQRQLKTQQHEIDELKKEVSTLINAKK